MKTNFITAIIFVLITACSSTDKPYLISGTINNVPQGVEYIYFENFVNNQPNKIDSAVIGENGSFAIQTANPPLDFYRLSITSDNFAIVVLDSTNTPEFQLSGVNLSKGGQVNGAPHTALLWEFYDRSNEFDNKREQMGQQAQGADQNTRANLIGQFQAMQQSYYAYLKQFIQDHYRSPASMAVLNKLDPVKDFDDYTKVADALASSMSDSPYFTFLQKQINQARARVAQVKAREEQERKRAELLAPGKEAPEINLPTPQGNLLPLSSLRGKVVLLDFWASWCKPCRAENPNVVRLYNKYKNKVFTVYSVSLDRSRDAWLRAIEQDNMSWNHVSDLAYWQSEAAQTYGVSGIPFTVLLDRNGKIIDTNLRGQGLAAKLQEILG